MLGLARQVVHLERTGIGDGRGGGVVAGAGTHLHLVRIVVLSAEAQRDGAVSPLRRVEQWGLRSRVAQVVEENVVGPRRIVELPGELGCLRELPIGFDERSLAGGRQCHGDVGVLRVRRVEGETAGARRVADAQAVENATTGKANLLRNLRLRRGIEADAFGREAGGRAGCLNFGRGVAGGVPRDAAEGRQGTAVVQGSKQHSRRSDRRALRYEHERAVVVGHAQGELMPGRNADAALVQRRVERRQLIGVDLRDLVPRWR